MHVFRVWRLLVSLVLMTSFPVSANGSSTKGSKDAGTKGLESISAVQATVEAMSLRFFRLAKLKQATNTSPRLDLSVVIPSTSSIGPDNFSLLKAFVRDLVKEFSVSLSGTRVSFVIHASAPSLAFSSYHFVNMECTLKGISSVRFQPGNASSWESVLSLVISEIFPGKKEQTPNVQRVLFIITDASSTYGAQASFFAQKLHDSGVEMFVLTVGRHVMWNEPNKVASKPYKAHVFRVGTFQDLPVLAKGFKGKGFHHTCNGSSIILDECHRRCHCKNGRKTDCYRIRKDFTEMSLEERRRYVRAFKTVSTAAPYRTTYDRITKLHPRFFELVHEKEFFFPWHRWYLLAFENLLRHVDCRVTVPYWNWARAVSHKRMWRHTNIRDFWYPASHGLGGNGELRTGCVRKGPFRAGNWSLPAWMGSECLAREFDFKYYLPGEWYVNDLIKLPLSQFKKFEAGIRDFMHNDLHNAVGGTMSLDESAVTPEFWSHHAFLDKIWSDWQDRGTAFKFQYYNSVHNRLPGGNHFGWELMDLQKQPHCVRVLYEGTPDKKAPKENEERRRSYGPKDGDGDDYNDFDDNDDDDDDDDDVDDDDDDDVNDKNVQRFRFYKHH